MSQSKSSKGKLIIVALVSVMLAMTSLACGSSDNVDAATVEPTPTQKEVDVYWEEQNAKEAIRQEAIRRELVIIEWRGDWQSREVALFHGQSLVRNIAIGKKMLDLVERDQITLKEKQGDDWVVVLSIPNDMQPGEKIVFVRSEKIEKPTIEEDEVLEVEFSLSGTPMGDSALFIDETMLVGLAIGHKIHVSLVGNERCSVSLKIRNAEGEWEHVTSLGCIDHNTSIDFTVDGMSAKVSQGAWK